ncbi:twin-arginine translocase subunit TatC [Oceanospirillum sediminis]|uniref:Sec-independent protein translocase protein TatC n=1 Tax=Oceanospirillum sediminis TaxID=2760088 RepID=A0A839ITI2_9GAMM|nr:twin-arginine translocase subunit TatC [Oceanospirillum sediminis]MBB1487990.1 twin-arginine translocase subunit TatC [Oceanospirillum sediminis]
MSQTESPQLPPVNDDTARHAPLVEHLIELRGRLLRAVLAILIIFVGMYPFANELYMIVSEPLRALLPEGTQMIATEVASPFLAPFKLTLVLALFAAVPYVLFQAWSFIAPGLYQHEKKIAVPLLASSIFLFYAGAVFAYYVVFPIIFAFFTQAGPGDVAVMTDINSYLNFVLKLFFAFGVAFEIPVATFILIWTGITTVESLSAKRPYVVIACFVVGMLLTPPDVISQTLLALPMWVLYELGILMGRMVKRSEQKQDDKQV